MLLEPRMNQPIKTNLNNQKRKQALGKCDLILKEPVDFIQT